MFDKNHSLTTLLHPMSIAITGVTRNPEDIGTYILRNIIYAGFEGKVFPINSEVDQLYSLDTYKSVEAIKEEVDLVVLASPHDQIVEEVIACARARVNNICIITAGFAETGHSGQILQKKVTNIAQQAGIRVLGPNSLGLISTSKKLNATFGPTLSDPSKGYGLPERGNAVFISQSGALINALIEYSKHYSFGLAEAISLGNKADINENVLLEYYASLRKDGQPQVVGAYLEGFADPKEFMELGAKVSQQFPFLLLTPTETSSVQEYVFSHSGSILQRKQFIELGLSSTGVVQVSTQQQLFDSMLGFSWQPLPRGENIAIVSNAGSGLILAIDQFHRAGLSLVNFSTEVKRLLTKEIHWRRQKGGVVDLGGTASSLNYLKAVDIVLGDHDVNAVIVILSPQGMTEIEESAEVIGRLTRQHGKTIVGAFLGYENVEQGIRTLAKYHIPAFNSIDRAVFVLSKMVQFFKTQKVAKELQTRFVSLKPISEDRSSKALRIVEEAKAFKVVDLAFEKCIELFKSYEILLEDISSVKEKGDVAKLGERFSYPVELSDGTGKKRMVAYNNSQAEKLFVEHFEKEREEKGCFVRKYYSGKRRLSITIAKDTYYEFLTKGFTARDLQQLSFGYAMEISSECRKVSGPIQLLLPATRERLETDIETSNILAEFEIKSNQLRVELKENLISLVQKIMHIPPDFPQLLSVDVDCVVSNHRIVVIDCKVRLDLMSI